MAGRQRYSVTTVPVGVREAFARLAAPLAARGLSQKDYLAALVEAGFPVTKPSLIRWVGALAQKASPFKIQKRAGVQPLLDRDQLDISYGFVLDCFDRNVVVSLASYQKFCAQFFNIQLSQATAHRCLTRGGFSSRKVQHKAKGFTVDIDELSSQMVAWADERRRHGDFKGLCCSIDFTYTGQRTRSVSSYSPIGGAQPKTSAIISSYTNCIITVVWSDGVNRTPPVLFTYNGKFRRGRVGRVAWKAEEEHLNAMMRHYEVEPYQIVYVGKPQKETRTFVSESADLLRQFFSLYDIPEGAVIFSDNGKSFFTNGNSNLTQYGFAKHVPYPAAVHHLLSPNDNRLHGTAKMAWRAKCVDFRDDVDSCCMLLNYLEHDARVHGRAWFCANMLNLTLASAKTMMRGRARKSGDADAERRLAYRVFMGVDARGPQKKRPREVQDGLDGQGWLKKSRR